MPQRRKRLSGRGPGSHFSHIGYYYDTDHQRVGAVSIPVLSRLPRYSPAYRGGADIIKVFPLGGVAYFRDLRGPLPGIPLMRQRHQRWRISGNIKKPVRCVRHRQRPGDAKQEVDGQLSLPADGTAGKYVTATLPEISNLIRNGKDRDSYM